MLKFNRPLWDHQEHAWKRFQTKHEMALIHDMGTGKTTTAITWLRGKYSERREVFPTLIVSPVATLDGWCREIKNNAAAHVLEKTAILYGKGEDRRKMLRDPGKQIFITNPETFDMPTVVRGLVERNFDAIIVDEAHKFKNFKSKRLKQLLSVSDQTTLRAILTGTPILNSYLDVWALWRILDKGETFGTNFFVFRETYFRDENLAWKGKPNYFPSYVPKLGTDGVLATLMDRKASRVSKAECLTLPPVVYSEEHTPMGAEQAKVYNAMEAELIAEVRDGVCTATNALTRVLRLLQIVSGYARIEDHSGVKMDYILKENPRLNRLHELLEELTPKHKVVVWCVFEQNYHDVARLAEDLKIGMATLTGLTKNRAEELRRFKEDPNCRLMVSNPQAGGAGVDGMQVAAYAIYLSRSFSLGDRLQSEARTNRGGSEIHENLFVIDLVTPGTIEEDVLSALKQKEDFSDAILERLKR